MAATLIGGPSKPNLTREMELGHRTYKVTYKVKVDAGDGPAVAILCPGLPQYGDVWHWGTEADDWAWCRWGTEVRAAPDCNPDKPELYHVTFTFSTKPDDKACTADQTQDPLLIPPKLSGNFHKFREEATFDRFGRFISNSAFEQIRGPQIEFDSTRPIVKIEMPVPILNLPLLLAFQDKVNLVPIWGFPKRCVKLSQIGWERLFYGVCYVYYKWNLEFEINAKTWDKLLPDFGSLALSGTWIKGNPNWVLRPINGYPAINPDTGKAQPNPNPQDPTHYLAYQDRSGNTAKTFLNGYGLPAGQVNGYGATAVANLNPDFNPDSDTPAEVVSVDVIDGGFGYLDTTPPFVAFVVGEDEGDVIAAAATCTVDKGRVTKVTVTSGGEYFFKAPQVEFRTITQVPSTGQLHIQKYDEADFTLLGIPLYF